MTKPRFTPDPIPYSFTPEMRAAIQREFERMEDLWPKDLEQRLIRLEQLQSARIGDWPIIDSGNVNLGLFNPQPTYGPMTCEGQLVELDELSTPKYSSRYIFNGPEKTWVAVPQTGFVVYDPDDDSSVTYTDPANDSQTYPAAGVMDLSGSVGNKRLFVTLSKRSGWNWFLVYNIALDTLVPEFAARDQATNYTPSYRYAAETLTKFFCCFQGSPVTELYPPRYFLKPPNLVPQVGGSRNGYAPNDTLSFASIGGSHIGMAACNCHDEKILVIARRLADLTIYDSYIVDFFGGSPTITGPIDSSTTITAVSLASSSMNHTGVRVGDNCYFACSPNGSYGSVIKVDIDGNFKKITSIPSQTPGREDNFTLPKNDHTCGQLDYDASSNSLYGTTQADSSFPSLFFRYKIADDTVEVCEPVGPTGWLTTKVDGAVMATTRDKFYAFDGDSRLPDLSYAFYSFTLPILFGDE